MRVQGISLAMTDVRPTLNSNHNEQIEKLQEQIQNVQKSEHYDVDTKQKKIEELKEQIKQIEEAKRMQGNEALSGNAKQEQSNIKNDSISRSNRDGDTLEVSLNSKAFIDAGMSLDTLKNSYSVKRGLEGKGNVLKSEIENDRSRNIDTKKKEERLSDLYERVEKAASSFGEAVKNANEAADNMNESTRLEDEIKDVRNQEDKNKEDINQKG